MASSHVPRLYLDVPLHDDGIVHLEGPQAHHLLRVLRLKIGEIVLIFNGTSGEWRGQLEAMEKRTLKVRLLEHTRPPAPPWDLECLFAPIKPERTVYIVEKATELGCARLSPVVTKRTQNRSFSIEKARQHAISAAQQCGLIHIPDVTPHRPLSEVLETWPEQRPLLWCDEAGSGAVLPSLLAHLAPKTPVSVLIGPEGGFDPAEGDLLRSLRYTFALSLGPRILRADTAVVSALTLVQAFLGDWS